MSGQSIVEFIDPHNKDHMEAFKQAFDKGVWPEDFLPKDIKITAGWSYHIMSKIVEAWLKYTLKDKQQSSNQTEFLRLNEIATRLFAAKKELDSCRDEFLAAEGKEAGEYKCPTCGSPSKNPQDFELYCSNPKCPDKHPDRLAELREKYSSYSACFPSCMKQAKEASIDINELIDRVEEVEKDGQRWKRHWLGCVETIKELKDNNETNNSSG